MFNNLNIIFFSMTLLGSIISISSATWFSAWLGLEINLISFVPLIINNNDSLSTESAMKYFIIQASSSAMFIFLCVMNSLSSFYYLTLTNTPNLMILLVPLMIKLGSAPFQTWFINMMQSLNWFACYIVATMQKIAPLFLTSFLYFNSKFILLFTMASVLVGSMGGLNQTSLKKIMAFSSVNHLGWMLTAAYISKYMLTIYFLIYSLMNMFVMTFLSKTSIYYLTQNHKNTNKINLAISMLSLGGLPPFLGFLPKWMIIQSLIMNKMFLLALLMVMTALITLFYYIRVIISTLIMNFSSQKWFSSIANPSNMITALNMISSLGLITFNMILN